MPSEWVLFNLDEIVGIFPSKKAAIDHARVTACDERLHPVITQWPDGLYEYEGPRKGRSRLRTFYFSNRPNALRAAGVDMEAVEAFRKQKTGVRTG